jgi:hypothetical protein
VISEDGERLPHLEGAEDGGGSVTESRSPGFAPDPKLEGVPARDSQPTDERLDRSTEAAPSTAEPTSAALRDAGAIAERVAADERAADEERQRLVGEPLPVIGARDLPFDLQRGELLHAERHAALLERARQGTPSGGMLYLTSLRMVHVGSTRIEEVPLERISDMAVSMERLLLIELRDGTDLAIEVDRPRLLRVQVAAARTTSQERST